MCVSYSDGNRLLMNVGDRPCWSRVALLSLRHYVHAGEEYRIIVTIPFGLLDLANHKQNIWHWELCCKKKGLHLGEKSAYICKKEGKR